MKNSWMRLGKRLTAGSVVLALLVAVVGLGAVKSVAAIRTQPQLPATPPKAPLTDVAPAPSAPQIGVGEAATQPMAITTSPLPQPYMMADLANPPQWTTQMVTPVGQPVPPDPFMAPNLYVNTARGHAGESAPGY